MYEAEDGPILSVPAPSGRLDAGRSARLGGRVVDEGGQAVSQVHGVARGVLLHGLSERVDVCAVEPEVSFWVTY